MLLVKDFWDDGFFKDMDQDFGALKHEFDKDFKEAEKQGKTFKASKSIKKQTVVENGKKKSITTTVVHKPDGTKVEERLEEIDDGKGNIERKKFINGEPAKQIKN